MRLVRPRTLAALGVTTLAAAGLVAVTVTPAQAGTSVSTIAPGVTLHHQTLTISGRHQSVYWVTQRFSSHTKLVVATPRHVIGATRMTTLALGNQEHALAGLNGDTFYFSDPTAVPRGGLMHDGYLLKAPIDYQNAVFYLTADGRSHIGPVGYTGRAESSLGGGIKQIHSLNSPETATNGNLTLTDSNLMSRSLHAKCAEVQMVPTSKPGLLKVIRYDRYVSYYHRMARGHRAFVSCSSRNRAYFDHAAKVGHFFRTSVTYKVKNIRTMISGVRQLVANGRTYNDKHGLNVYGNKHLPETFVCVPRDGRGVSLGVFEGQRTGAVGVTYAEETKWLRSRGCWSAMTVDGSTSSTLVARRPGHGLAVQNRPTAPYKSGQRPQVDGIFIVKR